MKRIQSAESAEDRAEILVEDRAVDIFDLLGATSGTMQPDHQQCGGALTVRFEGFDVKGYPMVSGLPMSSSGTVAARTTVSLQEVPVGAEVVVLCEHNDVECPIIVGVLQEPQPGSPGADQSAHSMSIQADGERQIISAEREIVLRCGDASITLTRAGKILLKGTYVVSRSSGVNRIKGGSVQIN